MQGQIYFYEYDGMKYMTQMDCRNHNGKYSKGCKVTGISFDVRKEKYTATTTGENSGNNVASRWTNQQAQLLITTNDSRIRLCKLNDYSVICKFKGAKNKQMQIKAHFSDDCKLIISGSENGKVFIWPVSQGDHETKKISFWASAHEIERNSHFETFDCTDGDEIPTTVALFAPNDSIRHFLSSQVDLYASLLNSKKENILAPSDPANVPLDSEMRPSGMGNLAGRRNGSDAGPVLFDSEIVSRVIITADSTGIMRVFVRLS